MNSGTELTAGKTTARRWVARTVGALVAVAGVGLLGTGQGFAAGGTLAVTSVYSDTTVADHTEGISYGPLWGASSVPIATFTDSDACPTPTTCQPGTDYTARVLWGDGSATTICAAPFTAACTISASATAGTYNVTATHAFVDEKSGGVTPAGFTIHVVVNDSIDAAGTGATGNNGAASGLMVTDQASGQSSPAFPGFTAAAGTAYTGPIGSFHDGNQDVIATDVGPTSKPEYTFSINWGDGTALDTTSGTFTIDQINCGSAPGLGAGQGCPITVNGGPHTYAAAGTYTVTTAVKDGANAALTVTGTATVTSNSSANCTTATTTLTPTTNTVAAGTPILFTATSTACSAPKFQFWLQDPAGTGPWTIMQPFSVGTNTWNWTTDTKPGSYRVVVWANQTGHQTSTSEGFASATATVTGCGAATAAWSPASPQPSGTNPITLTGGTSGCASPQFEFWMLAPGSSTWKDVQQYSATAAFAWDTSAFVAGTYNFSVWAKDANSSGASGDSLGRWDNYVATSYTLTTVHCTGLSVTSSPNGTAPAGTTVTITGTAFTCPFPLYEFWMLAPGSSTWTVAQGYTTGNSFVWTTTAGTTNTGLYHFSVWAKDSGSAGLAGNSLGRWDVYVAITYTLT